jgi:toxin-antitoxin system PIN domain toxin
VIAVDTNVLVYAHVEQFPKHAAARTRLESLAEGRRKWGIPSVCVQEFLRIVTHPRVLRSPYPLSEAITALNSVLASPSAEILLPGEQHWLYLIEASEEAGARGNLIFDAAIVAICRENGATEIVTEDRDFDRFSDFPTARL